MMKILRTLKYNGVDVYEIDFNGSICFLKSQIINSLNLMHVVNSFFKLQGKNIDKDDYKALNKEEVTELRKVLEAHTNKRHVLAFASIIFKPGLIKFLNARSPYYSIVEDFKSFLVAQEVLTSNNIELTASINSPTNTEEYNTKNSQKHILEKILETLEDAKAPARLKLPLIIDILAIDNKLPDYMKTIKKWAVNK